MAGDAGFFVWEGCGKTIRFIDMFAGIGGFREGLTRAGGFTCVGHCECDKYAERSYCQRDFAGRNSERIHSIFVIRTNAKRMC